MQWRLIINCFILVCAFSCKNNPAPKALEVSIPDDFFPFYDMFHSDSTFQMEHIIFPLDGIPAEQGLRGPEWTWDRDEWVLHRPFDDKGTFKRSWYAINSIIVEKISDSSGRFTMERRWARMGGEWNLIYYKEMGI